MSFASTSRQPCSVDSCMEVTRKLAVRAEHHVEMRALPGEHLGRGLGVGKPERHAAVMRDREPQAFRREGEPADARRQVERLDLALGGAHERLLAGAPGDNAVRPERDAIDPAMLGVGRQRLACALRVGHNHLAVVAAGQNARAVARNGEDAALMHCDALLGAIGRDEQQRLLAERERRGLPEKMRRDDRRARRDGLVRSTTEGIWAWVSVISLRCHPSPKGRDEATPRSSQSPCGSSPRAGCAR